jgi:hypothetical protein
MLRSSSPELSWDEADHASNVNKRWSYLWSQFDYSRHSQGPLAIYLAKLGDDYLPSGIGSLEDRLRLPAALFSSLVLGSLIGLSDTHSKHHVQQRFWVPVRCCLALFGSKIQILSGPMIQYKAFVQENRTLLSQTASAIVYGIRDFNFYAQNHMLGPGTLRKCLGQFAMTLRCQHRRLDLRT